MDKYISEENISLLLATHLIPPDEGTNQIFKIAIIGGSEGSVGEPYFAAMAALKVGIHAVHVFCDKDVGTVISSFHPEICIHAILDNSQFKTLIHDWLDCHVFIIGPGLGNKTVVLANVTRLIKTLKEKEKPIILCGGGLFAVSTSNQLMAGYEHAIIIMNNKEFQDTYMPDGVISSRAVFMSKLKIASEQRRFALLDLPATIVRIDKFDIIFNKHVETICSLPQNMKTIDANGELLSGVLGVFFLWGCQKENEADLTTVSMASCFAACKLLRECNVMAFRKHGRATLRSDIIEEIEEAFRHLFRNN